MTDQQERIRELERELERANARLVAGGLAPAPSDLPDDAQIDRLLELVRSNTRRSRPDQMKSRDEHRKHFRNAIHFLIFARRSDKLNTQYAHTVFLDECNVWLRGYGLGRTSLKLFLAACVASGVKTSSFARYPFDIELALELGPANHASFGWRDVLRDGLPPVLELQRRAIPVNHVALR